MIRLFKRRTKEAAAQDAGEPAAALRPVPMEATAPAKATSTAEPASGAILGLLLRSGASNVDDRIRVEEESQDNVLVVRADLPGVDPDRDIRVTVLDRHLVIEAERRQTNTTDADGCVIEEESRALYARSLPIRDGVDASAITGTYKDGVLEVRVPMPREGSAERAMRIPVTT